VAMKERNGNRNPAIEFVFLHENNKNVKGRATYTNQPTLKHQNEETGAANDRAESNSTGMYHVFANHPTTYYRLHPGPYFGSRHDIGKVHRPRLLSNDMNRLSSHRAHTWGATHLENG
jgi:hypothetical protein